MWRISIFGGAFEKGIYVGHPLVVTCLRSSLGPISLEDSGTATQAVVSPGTLLCMSFSWRCCVPPSADTMSCMMGQIRASVRRLL